MTLPLLLLILNFVIQPKSEPINISMSNHYKLLIILFLIFAGTLTSCKKHDHVLRVGLVSGIGSLHDRGFNQQALTGLQVATQQLPISWVAKESTSATEIDSNIRYFAKNNYDIVISLGYNASEATLQAANAYPSTKFILLDFALPTVPANLVCINYKVDEASFPCGYLAAYWALVKDSASPVVGYVAGPRIPEIDQFTVSFEKGIEYFNARYHKSVSSAGSHAGNFNDTLQGAHLADSLIRRGADVIFACGGRMGNGALYKAKENMVNAIGVDTDQYYSIPDVGANLLTSCIKRLDMSVEMELTSIVSGQFHGGQNLHSDLQNNGVDLAPYHDFDALISNTIKQEIQAIKSGIKNGTISTGWK